MTAAPVLEIKNLQIALPKGADRPFALQDLSLTLKSGELVCLVGERGTRNSAARSAAPPCWTCWQK